MKRLIIFLPALFILSLSCAQNQLDITIGAGYTAVDLDALIEKDEVSGTSLLDWDQFNIGFSAQYFFLATNSFQLGAEIMYQHQYWYRVLVPFGSTPIDREYTVTTTRITPVFRFGEGNFAFDVGPEFNFSDGLQLGLMLSANQYIPINDKIDIPVKGRIDIINGIVLTVPISINTGVRIKL
ncbi:MAG: hypothetical protein RIM99_07350 [Cyclobacteriaceae bacterium]